MEPVFDLTEADPMASSDREALGSSSESHSRPSSASSVPVPLSEESNESGAEDSELELSRLSSLAPYSFEPSDESDGDSASSSSTSADDDRDERLSDMSWCTCGHCVIMETSRECLCCREVSTIMDKMAELEGSTLQCITDHPGFASVCLDVWVLQTAYYQYRQHYGVDTHSPSLHEKYRYTAYRQLVRWNWGWLGI